MARGLLAKAFVGWRGVFLHAWRQGTTWRQIQNTVRIDEHRMCMGVMYYILRTWWQFYCNGTVWALRMQWYSVVFNAWQAVAHVRATERRARRSQRQRKRRQNATREDRDHWDDCRFLRAVEIHCDDGWYWIRLG